MGIKNLSKFLRNYCPWVYETAHLSHYHHEKWAIDLSGFLYRYKVRFGTNWVAGFINLVACLRKHNIHCLFVFDGQAPPDKDAEKQKRMNERDRKAKEIYELERAIDAYRTEGLISPVLQKILDEEKGKSLLRSDAVRIKVAEQVLRKKKSQFVEIADDDFIILRNLFDIMGVPYMLADGEAETLCAHLANHKLVNGVLSHDSDTLAYGVPYVKTSIDTSSETIVEIDHENLLQSLELTRAQFTDLCIMCGTDYNNNIPDIGPARAYGLLLEHGSIDGVRENAPELDTSILKHLRVRDLFSTPESFEQKVPYCRVANMTELENFISENSCKIDIQKIKKNLAPPNISFVEEVRTS